MGYITKSSSHLINIRLFETTKNCSVSFLWKKVSQYLNRLKVQIVMIIKMQICPEIWNILHTLSYHGLLSPRWWPYFIEVIFWLPSWILMSFLIKCTVHSKSYYTTDESVQIKFRNIATDPGTVVLVWCVIAVFGFFPTERNKWQIGPFS